MINLNRKCSIVILSFNQVEYTKKCLESIRKYTSYPYEIIIIDNASNKETLEYLEEQKDIKLIKNSENKGFAGGCNQGMELAEGNYIMLLNNDTIVTNHWLNNMVELLESNDEIAMVGPLTNNTVGKQKIQVPYEDDMEEMQAFANKISNSNKKPWRTLRLTGFCLLIRRSLINEVGMFDTQFKIGNYEDDDLCIRTLLANKYLYVCRNAFVHHYMNISFSKNNIPREEIMLKNKLLLENKWSKMNWNHHSITNGWLIQHVLDRQGMNILHIGCGLGATGIEIKDIYPKAYIVGIEEHPICKEIVKGFLDELYEWDQNLTFIQPLIGKQFDTIIIECSIEKSGLKLLELIKPLLRERSGQVLLRIFNINHVTTVERIVTGSVEGNLLCASSEEFTYYFDKNVENEIIHKYDYNIYDKLDVKKSLTIQQEKILGLFKEYSNYSIDGRVYNRLYQLVRK